VKCASSIGCAVVLAVALVACGSTSSGTSTTVPLAAAGPTPELARAPKAAGEVVLRGESSPKTTAPIAFDGRYRVRFQQYAPEDPKMGFADQTTFVVDLEPVAGGPAVKLFHAAAADGERKVRLSGRYAVDVSFGDFPYVIRFTPLDQ
jgi:hypothetical protein